MRTVIVESHLLTRDVMREVCARELGHDIVGEASTGREGIDLIGRINPGLVISAVKLPERSGFDVIEVARDSRIRPRLFAYSDRCDAYTVYRLERLRVDGFVEGPIPSVAELREAIAAVSGGRTYYSEWFQELKAARRQDPLSFDKLLGDRELGILTLMGDSADDDEIAARLGITRPTVERHRSNISRKLGLRTRAGLETYARTHGFTEAVIRGAADPQAKPASPGLSPVGRKAPQSPLRAERLRS